LKIAMEHCLECPYECLHEPWAATHAERAEYKNIQMNKKGTIRKYDFTMSKQLLLNVLLDLIVFYQAK
jgi:hypothetical protein